MRKIFQFGEHVEGYSIPVLNEREIRAAAGILFVLMFVSITRAALLANFTLLKYAIIAFLIDIGIRVLVNPRFAPFLIIGRWIVRNQVPEYVGAQQKRFAWVIGLVLAITMLIFQVLINSYGPITGIICMICLVFLFFETAFGICIGCKVYSLVYGRKAQYCPGEVCEIHNRHEIQKTGAGQWVVVLGLAAFIAITAWTFHSELSVPPYDILGVVDGGRAKPR